MTDHDHLTRRGFLAGAAALGVVGLTGVPVVAAAHTGSKWASRDWSPIPSLSDEFTHPHRSSRRWNRGLWYPQSGVGLFTDGNVSFEHGRLRLSATVGEPGGPAYRFGAVESFFDLPGVCSYVEVKARVLDSRARVLSAIWQQSSNYDHVDRLLEGADPNPEIDVEETFSYTEMVMANHTWGAAGHIAYGGHSYPTGVADISQGFHRYGIERLDGRLRFYFDRRLAWDLPAPHPSLARMSRHQVLSLEGHLGAPNPQYLPASYDIDYVRTYYRTAGRRAATGRYQIVNAATGQSLNIDGSGGLGLKSPTGRGGQVWWVRETPDYTYEIALPRHRRMLGLDGGQGQPGVAVVADDLVRTGPDDQGSRRRWHVLPGEHGTFSLRSKFSGLAIDAANQTLLQQEATDQPSQQWRLRPVR